MIGVVLVHYHAPALAREALEAVREDLERTGESVDVVVVDNGSAPSDRARVDGLPGRVIRPGENLGYAGGVNRGVRAVRGDHLLVMNPDVFVRPGCCAALVASLADGAAVAGPRFFWDRDCTLLLPPAEERTRRAELLGRLAPLAPVAAARGLRRRWRRHARRHWEAEGPFRSESLSGALLALRRDAWDEVGPFDEGYRLYYEETDWLRRLVRAGGSAVFEPRAEAVHLYDRSASTEPRSAGWFAASRRRFERRWYGRPFAGLLAGLDRWPRPVHGETGGATGETEPPLVEIDLPSGFEGPPWVEISPSPVGVPAAAQRLVSGDDPLSWRLSTEIWERLPAGTYRVQVVDSRGGEGPVRRLRKVDSGRPEP